ncbi:MFS-type transporter yjbB [Fictibacillus macauensis ZFHKF-1]|uniref:MFS-type transporter yjbB n=1 Tax=Fictibacillus macauensis ZFHKF-1 TaxID=1196324 RepID=I8UC71_9BACL|nr:MFS transporter [Fictibacillus macauensis]EIT84495.1 MFS-type transporter yjbB [Fictibacillus macauensis ZFHKF-1]
MKKQYNFLVLMVGQSLADLGDVLYIVGLISALYALTASATLSAFVPFTITLAMFISSLLTPLLIGNVHLKALLVWSQIGKTVLLVALGIFIESSLTTSNVYVIFILIGGIALLDGCAKPIRQTLIPYYVKEDQLVKANGLAETIAQTIQIGAWFFGSLLLLVLNEHQLIWLVALLFALASVLLMRLQHVAHHREHKEKKWSLLTQGWKTVHRTPVLKTIMHMEFFETMASAVWIAAILYIFVEEALQVEKQWWGFLNGSFFVGLVIGSIVCIQVAHYIDQKRTFFICMGASLSCLATLLFSMTSFPIFALILSFLIGFFGQLKNIPQQTVIQTSVPKEQLATVYTSIGTISTGVFGVSSLLIGLLADILGVRSVFALSGVLLAVASVIAMTHKTRFTKTTSHQPQKNSFTDSL